jgi:hypothetical protein
MPVLEEERGPGPGAVVVHPDAGGEAVCGRALPGCAVWSRMVRLMAAGAVGWGGES